jgi:glycosyltransferase involved in cell wall biosynthesis
MAVNIQSFLRSEVASACEIEHVRGDLVGRRRFREAPLPVAMAVALLNALVLVAKVFVRIIAFRPDVLHLRLSGWAGFWDRSLLIPLGRLMGCRVVAQLHSGLLELFLERTWRLGRWWVARSLRMCNRVVVISKAMERIVSQLGVTAERAVLIHNAVHLPARTVLDRTEAGEGDPIQIIYLGRIHWAKGLVELVEAVARVRREGIDLRLTMHGPGHPGPTGRVRDAIESADLGRAVQLAPPIDGQAKERAYLDADIYALPSRGEGMPLGLLEAMSFGLACVATPVGGVVEIIEDGRSGLLVPPRDVDALADALKRLATDAPLRRRLGQAAREAIEQHFNWRHRAGEYIATYRELLGRRGN